MEVSKSELFPISHVKAILYESEHQQNSVVFSGTNYVCPQHRLSEITYCVMCMHITLASSL